MPKFIHLPLEIVSTLEELNKVLAPYRANKQKIGFVPTMGALHKGHLSLINIAKEHNDIVVASIYVNPTQFNDPKDLEKYPRPLDEDEEMLTKAECDVLFIPTASEMYPKGDFSTLKEDFGNMDKVMEGKSRPGHFAGMITIVSKLFDAVKPDNAYFGSKDFQQLTLVKYFVLNHKLPINIVSCPIVREADGLAMSSRNRLLSVEEREHATHISQTLLKARELWGTMDIPELKKCIEEAFAKDDFLKLDYFEIVYAETLTPVEGPLIRAIPVVACIAAYDGNVRLIDNMQLA